MGSETDDTWTIKVNWKDKTITVHVPQNCEFAELMKAISEKTASDLGSIVVLYAGKTLSVEAFGKKKLSELTLEDGSLVVMALRLPGGIWPLNALKIKKRTLEPLPGYITITTSPSEPDMISLDNSTSKRAKMPCGHVIGSDSMTSYCHSLLSAGKFTFTCPHIDDRSCKRCGADWPFFLVRHVACLLPEELEKFEKQASENALMKSSGFQQCPGCSIWCCQADPKNKCTRCVECTRANNNIPYDFCWECLGTWNGNGFGGSCGNANCCGKKEKKIKILSECIAKLIGGVVCPSIRACPKCGIMIEHKEACKHMTCECKYSFCFACLKPKAERQEWECSPYDEDCEPAPRQTSLPTEN